MSWQTHRPLGKVRPGGPGFQSWQERQAWFGKIYGHASGGANLSFEQVQTWLWRAKAEVTHSCFFLPPNLALREGLCLGFFHHAKAAFQLPPNSVLDQRKTWLRTRVWRKRIPLQPWRRCKTKLLRAYLRMNAQPAADPSASLPLGW